MNELERIILKEKLKPMPNFDYIRWLQQLNLEQYKKSSVFKNKDNNSLFIPK
tara:strand:- start:5299 stop:5454 length:156 start_codon:yes stop_codon:yes gene_type:complete